MSAGKRLSGVTHGEICILSTKNYKYTWTSGVASRMKRTSDQEAAKMNNFQRRIYTDMNSVDRILIWMTKYQEFMEFSRILTDQDIKNLYEICDLMKRGTPQEKEDNDG